MTNATLVEIVGGGSAGDPGGAVSSVQVTAIIKSTVTFTVANGADESAAVDVRNVALGAIQTPSDLEGLTSITAIMHSLNGSSGWTTVTDENGDALAPIALTVDSYIGLGPYARYLLDAAYLKLVFNTTAGDALTFTGRATS